MLGTQYFLFANKVQEEDKEVIAALRKQTQITTSSIPEGCHQLCKGV